MYRYVEDSMDARQNRLTFVGNGGKPAYDFATWKFSEESTTEHVTLVEAKDWCAVDGNDYDTRITMLIKAAREEVETALKISLINRTVTAHIKPGTNLPYGPVIRVLTIVDQNGTDYADYADPYMLDSLNYNTGAADINAVSVDADLANSNYARHERIYTVTYLAGFEDGAMPVKYKTKILQQVAYMLENRGDESNNGATSPIVKPRNSTRFTKR